LAIRPVFRRITTAASRRGPFFLLRLENLIELPLHLAQPALQHYHVGRRLGLLRLHEHDFGFDPVLSDLRDVRNCSLPGLELRLLSFLDFLEPVHMPLHRGQCFGIFASDKPFDRHQPIAGHREPIESDPPLFVESTLDLEALTRCIQQLPHERVDRIGRLGCRRRSNRFAFLAGSGTFLGFLL